MKTENAVIVYSDTEYEQTTRADMEHSRMLLQELLDMWNKYDLEECADINSLLMQPEKVYQRAINNLVQVPETPGRFAVSKESFIKNLVLPDPAPLYALAKKIKQQRFTAASQLWTIKDNKVILVESEAEIYVDARSIYAESPEAVRFARDMTKLCELMNSVNQRVKGEILRASPWLFNWSQGRFKIREHAVNKREIYPDPEFLKAWLPRFK